MVGEWKEGEKGVEGEKRKQCGIECKADRTERVLHEDSISGRKRPT